MGSAFSGCCSETPSTVVKNQKIQKTSKDDVDRSIEQKNETGNNEVDLQKYLQLKSKNKNKYQFNDFYIQGFIGNGAFGVVFLAQLKQNMAKQINEKYAIKKVSKQLLKTSRVIENAKLDQKILSMNACRFIVALIMAFQDKNYIYYVMEFAIGGDTYSLIKPKSPSMKDYKQLGENAVQFIAACVILGLQFLHKNQIMYRDLKPQNVLIMKNGYVKLTDFGLAKKSVEDQTSKTISGTTLYYAPQMVLKLGYTKNVDIWTLGVYLYQLSVLNPPFTADVINRHKFKEAVLNAQTNRNWKNSNLSPQLKDLINSILKFDPKKRLGANSNFTEIKNHAFFKDFDWNALQQEKIQSPLQNIVKKYPVKIKPYKPQTQTVENPSNSEDTFQMDGWTYTRR